MFPLVTTRLSRWPDEAFDSFSWRVNGPTDQTLPSVDLLCVPHHSRFHSGTLVDIIRGYVRPSHGTVRGTADDPVDHSRDGSTFYHGMVEKVDRCRDFAWCNRGKKHTVLAALCFSAGSLFQNGHIPYYKECWKLRDRRRQRKTVARWTYSGGM